MNAEVGKTSYVQTDSFINSLKHKKINKQI